MYLEITNLSIYKFLILYEYLFEVFYSLYSDPCELKILSLSLFMTHATLRPIFGQSQN